jgi:hypothetical protein
MDQQPEDTRQTSTKLNKLPEVVNPRHKLVMDNLISGMAKAKAYQSIYPKCLSASAAFQQVRTIMANTENKAYYEAALEHKKYYINQKNQLTLDGTAAILFEVIRMAKVEATDHEARPGDRVNALKLMKDTAIDYSKLIGHGTYDPAIKYQIEAAQEELKALQLAKDKATPPEDDELAKLINAKPIKETTIKTEATVLNDKQ